MHDSIMVNLLYVVPADTEIALPKGKTKDDIKDIYVKWNVLHIEWHDGTYWDVRLTEDLGGIESKQPLETRIYPMNEDGTCDYGDTIFEIF
jgi:hypothetical protein